MSLKRSGLVLAGLLIIALVVMVAPVSATTWTVNPGDSIQHTVDGISNGDIINFNPGVYYLHGIKFSKDVIIKANTSAGGSQLNTIIDAQYSGGIFDVSGTNSLTIDNLTFKNGFADTFGGAIFSFGSVTITSSTFTGCSAKYDGGAIEAGTITVTSSTFTGCSVSEAGGAIEAGTITITSSTFTGCTAEYGNAIQTHSVTSGGAISSSGPITVTSSTFASCTAEDGGAISGPVTVTSSTFTGCSASETGGAISSTSPITVASSTFASCTAGYGGAISGPVTVTSSTFTGCSAKHDGGVISSSGPITVTSSTFTGCSAGYGGAISFKQDCTIKHSRFINCSSVALFGKGGVIYTEVGTLTIDDSLFSGSGWTNEGGAIYTGSGGTIHNSAFSNCPAGYGGAIDSFGDQPLTVSGSSFINCSATGHSNSAGGAIYAKDPLTVTNSTFDDCMAYPDGGAIYSERDTTIDNAKFYLVLAEYGDGGGVYTEKMLNISNSEFHECLATYSSSSAIYAKGMFTIDPATSSHLNQCTIYFNGKPYSPPGT